METFFIQNYSNHRPKMPSSPSTPREQMIRPRDTPPPIQRCDIFEPANFAILTPPPKRRRLVHPDPM
jgi:hypothetical protein